MRTIASLLTALSMMGAATIYADSREWTSDPPKHPDSYYVWCTARGEIDGHTYTLRNYVDTFQNSGWRAYADRVFRDDVQRYFRFSHGVEIDRSAISVDCG